MELLFNVHHLVVVLVVSLVDRLVVGLVVSLVDRLVVGLVVSLVSSSGLISRQATRWWTF